MAVAPERIRPNLNFQETMEVREGTSRFQVLNYFSWKGKRIQRTTGLTLKIAESAA
jgi:hypothetical protein